MPPTRQDIPGGAAFIAADRPCPRCGYNLRGLKAGGRCPECGQPIRSAAKSRFLDTLTDAPIAYLRVLALGAWLMALGSLGSALAMFAAAAAGVLSANAAIYAGTVAVWVLCAVAWWVGVYIVTAPRRGGIANTDAAAEWRILRRVNRGLQGFWVAGAILAGASAAVPSPLDGFLARAGLLCCVAALAGIVPLCVQLADLAAWANETGLADQFRVAAWGLTLFGSAALLAVPVGVAVRSVGSTVGFVIFVTNGIAILSVIVFFICLVGLARTCTWAIRNAQHKMGRDLRLAEKVARQVQLQKAGAYQAPAPVLPGEPDAPVPLAPPAPRSPKHKAQRGP
jgi:hypothetical protein